MESNAKVVIVGGGHNGLTAAAYLAKAGLEVTVLEQLDNFGGAAVSAQAFSGVDAKLSRYSYLVSLLPQQIIDDLGLEIRLAHRRYSSYTPIPETELGLLVDNQDGNRTQSSFQDIDATADLEAWKDFYAKTRSLAEVIWPTVLQPLERRSALRGRVLELLNGEAIWQELIETPVGDAISKKFQSDLVRGVVYTDALIGTFASNQDLSLSANRCFLYHVIGGGTGDWNVPVGGMGAVTSELKRAALAAGATLLAGAEVSKIETDQNGARVSYQALGAEREIYADYVLVNTARQELNRLLGVDSKPLAVTQREPYPYGAQVKVNLMLTRLPRLRDPSVTAEQAFGGTFHINEGFENLQAAFLAASAGSVPSPLPCEIYCHSLSDPSILSKELQDSGAHTLTVFALQAPHLLVQGLSEEEHAQMREQLQQAVLSSLNSVLAEPIENLIMLDSNSNPCIETKTTRDLEQALKLPGGNIFHEPLSWPFAEDEASLSTPAKRWGVDSGFERILLCGSAAKRGGAVSGIAGHNAAHALLELLAE